jgi:hypothetical protein
MDRQRDEVTASQKDRATGQTEEQTGIYTNMSMKVGCTCSNSDELGCGGKRA